MADQNVLPSDADYDEVRTARWTDGVYSNCMDGDEDGRSVAAFADNLERLKVIKAKYDPHNFFNANQNIVPVAP